MSSSVGEASPALSDRSVSSAEDAGVLPGVPASPLSSPVRERARNSASVTPQNPFSTMEANTPQSPTRSQITQLSPHPSPSSPGTAAPATPLEVPLPRLPQSAPANHTNNNSATPMTSTALFQHAATAPRPQRQEQIQIQNNSFALDDDENTEPSSMGANDSDNNNNPASEQRKRSTSFARFVRYTRRHLSFGQDDDDDDDIHGDRLPENSVICGYLQKLGRNGKWQTRWFETDGECLSYYKSSKRVKLLATLDLEKVGQIEMDESDEKGCSFCIQVLGRMYHLRAESRASCKDWVINLNRVKEARMQQGNVKLVDPAYTQPVDLLDPASGDVVAPRIVVVANRERTRAVDQDQEWDDLMTRQEHNNNNNNNMASNQQHSNSSLSSEKRRSTLGTVVLARWSKRKTSLNRLSAKLARWARSVRKYGCATEQSVHLDHHVHPPGHDYHSKQAKQVQSSNNNLNAWIGKETSRSAMEVVGDSDGSVGAGDGNDEEDNNVSDDNNTNRHLVPNTSKPGQISREISDASEDGGARYLL